MDAADAEAAYADAAEAAYVDAADAADVSQADAADQEERSEASEEEAPAASAASKPKTARGGPRVKNTVADSSSTPPAPATPAAVSGRAFADVATDASEASDSSLAFKASDSSKPSASSKSSRSSSSSDSSGAAEAPEPMGVAQREQLFRQLVDAHQKRLYRFILKNVGNATDAEDLAQQAFTEAVRSFVTFRGESELSTWLYGIAMNLVRNFLSRSPHRLHHFETDEGLADTALDNKNPADQVESNQVLARLQRELDELPAEMRDVLVLVAVDDLSYEEAAAMLSIPIGTVRSRVARARATLRTRLAKLGITFDF